MGYGNYSHTAHEAITHARAEAPRQEVFKQSACHPAMNPFGVKLRESRDSAAHPRSLGIAFALDVTGSMGRIAEQLARRELPRFMKVLLDCRVADPQVLFLAVGDAKSDSAPLQVGQFESGEREMDGWLTSTYLEGGGGGNGKESYELGLYFLARHTAMDCWEKRQRRGYLFMTGDDLPWSKVYKAHVDRLIGDGLPADLKLAYAVEDLQRTFDPYFLVPDPKRRKKVEAPWRKLLGDGLILLQDPADTCYAAAAIVALGEGVVPDLSAAAAAIAAAGASPPIVESVVGALAARAPALIARGAATRG